MSDTVKLFLQGDIKTIFVNWKGLALSTEIGKDSRYCRSLDVIPRANLVILFLLVDSLIDIVKIFLIAEDNDRPFSDYSTVQ